MGRCEQESRAHDDCEADQIYEVVLVLALCERGLLAPETPGEERIKSALRQREVDDRVVFFGEECECASHHGKGEHSRRDRESLWHRVATHAATSRNPEASSPRKSSRRSPRFAVANIVCSSAVEWGAELARRLAEKFLPSRSSPARSLNEAASSTSYHSGRTWMGRPISAARSMVCAKTVSVLQAMPAKRRRWSALQARR